MKRILFAVIACLSAVTMYAQVQKGNVYVMKDGKVIETFLQSEVDSITWYPYHVQEVNMRDTLRITRSFLPTEPASLELMAYCTPYYTTDTAWYELSNNDVVAITSFRYYNSISLEKFVVEWAYHPIQAGSTRLTVHVGAMKRDCEIIVTMPSVEDITAGADSLFSNIYSRLTITGNKQPYGDCDISGFDESSTLFYRMMHELNELSADQMWWIWSDIGITDLRDHSWKADNTIIGGLFFRLYKNIDFCNQYLDITANSTDTEIVAKRAEARFMRAFYYSYLLDMFGSVPIITTHSPTDYPKQATRTELFQFVVSELKEVADLLPASGLRASYYRVDRVAAWLLLSRVYLNGQVYAGADFFNEAANYAKKVIDSNYALATNYRHLFMGDNEPAYLTLGNTAAQEVILAADQNPQTARSWGGSKFLICAYSDAGSTPYTGCPESWKIMRSKTNLINLFFTDDEVLTVKDSITTAQAHDDRALFCSSYNGKEYSFRCNQQTDFYGCWAVVKYTNLGASQAYKPSDSQWPDMDIPLMRKAEAYLTYAEAVMRGAAEQDGLTALQAVNTLRERANATSFTTLTLQDIIDEWGREFYAEGRRRSDLIRFGMFGGQADYNWEGKAGMNCTDSSTFDLYRNIYPIPDSYRKTNPNIIQNEGY